MTRENVITCTIPTYRNDLKIEEDLIEEVARMYGYNNFPKTMIIGETPSKQIPYFRDYKALEQVKTYFTSCGYSEVYTYSLISETDLTDIGIYSDTALRADNPVSKEFEYLRPTLKSNLMKASRQNPFKTDPVELFELGKIYTGKSIDKAKESYALSGISNRKNYFEVKGILERLFQDLGVNADPTKYIEILDENVFFELDFSGLLELPKKQKIFVPIPKYPSITEDISFTLEKDVKVGSIIDAIRKQSELIIHVSLLDSYQTTKTFHVVYQSEKRNLTTEDVQKIREKIIAMAEKKFSAKIT